MTDRVCRSPAAITILPVKSSSSHNDPTSLFQPNHSPWAKHIALLQDPLSAHESGLLPSRQSGRRAATFQSGSSTPLLTERESIFATHYTPADNDSLPHSLPARAGTFDPSSLSHSLNSADMELSLPLFPASRNICLRSALAATVSKSGGMATRLQPDDEPKTINPTHHYQDLPFGKPHLDSRKPEQEDRRGSSVTTTSPRLPEASHTTDVPLSDRPAVAGTEETMLTSPEASQHSAEDRTRLERQSSMKQALQSPRTGRSSSRGRPHVEKSIEATLANTKPGKNVRSRKSSHYMGLFKEAGGRPDLRSRRSLTKDDLGVNRSEEHAPSKPSTADVWQSPVDPLSRPYSSDSLSSAFKGDDQFSSSTPTGRPVRPHHASSMVEPPPLSQENHDSYFDKRKILHEVPAAERPLPPGFLSQTRQAGDAMPSEPRGPGATRFAQQATKAAGGLAPNQEPLKAIAVTPRPKDEEHISGLVYVPHAGLPLEELEEHLGAPSDRSRGKEQSPVDSTVPPVGDYLLQAERPPADAPSAEHIDISVQSDNEKSVFHGNYQPEDVGHDDHSLVHLPTIGESAIETVSSASESDYELDEESRSEAESEGGEAAPTVIPRPYAPLKRRKRSSVSAGPKGAVVLEPFNHQVGGHSTIFRFSRRAVCKQLNNRENEFYERIERRHPEMLRFLPRYIGVLNVTFSKGPKPASTVSKVKERGKHAETNKESSDPPQGNKPSGESQASRLSRQDEFDNQERQPRIVSQSQHIGERPQVILNQNRHIVPFSFFEPPERPHSTGPHNSHRALDTEMSQEAGESGKSESTVTEKGPTTPPRPTLSTSSPSWGSTTVNSTLKDQVLRDVFGPPLIHHHRRHAKAHGTHPRLKDPSIQRKSNFSADLLNPDRRNASIPPNQWRTPLQDESSDLSTMSNGTSRVAEDNSDPTSREIYSASASVFEDLSLGLEKINTTNSINSNDTATSNTSKIKRRHSGMGLRRTRNSMNGSDVGDLEYFEDPHYGEKAEEEMFKLDTEAPSLEMIVPNPLARDGDVKNVITSSDALKNDQQIADPKYSEGDQSRIRSADFQTSLLPSNPKEAQLAHADQRVVYFLLLEDLTTGMGRPCVLDLKMGTRQYGVEANKKKKESQRRKCKTTTSLQLGVRICGMQTFNVKSQQPAYEDKYFGRDLKAGKEFREALTRFLYDGVSYGSVTRHIPRILDKLAKLENMVRSLPGYRFYASSLLMIYDAEPEKSHWYDEEMSKQKTNGRASKEKKKPWPPPIELKIVDFANCVTAEDALPKDAPCPPHHPQNVDRGYLRGLRTLRVYFQRILREINEGEFVQRGEGEAMAIGVPGNGASHDIAEEDEGEVST